MVKVSKAINRTFIKKLQKFVVGRRLTAKGTKFIKDNKPLSTCTFEVRVYQRVVDSEYNTLDTTPTFEMEVFTRSAVSGKWTASVNEFKLLSNRTFFFNGLSKFVLPFLGRPLAYGTIDQYDFESILKKHFKGDELYDLINILRSANPTLVIENFKFGSTYKIDPIDIADEQAFDDVSINTRMINFKYIDYKTTDQTELSSAFQSVYNSEYVLKNFVHRACWFSTVLDIFKKPIESAYKKTKLTYESLYEMVHNKPLDLDNMGASFNQVVDGFFKRFKVAVYLFDINCRVKAHYDPEDEGVGRNRHIRPHVVYFLYHDKHIYHLNSDLKSLEQLLESYCVESDIIEKPKSKYHLPKPIDEETQVYMIESTDDLLEVVQTSSKSQISCVYLGDLLEFWLELYQNHKYEATMIFRGCSVSEVRINNINKKRVSITNLSDEFTPDTFVDSVESLRAFEKAKNRFNTKMLNNNYLSTYSQQVQEVFSRYSRGGVIGGFCETEKNYSYCVDFNKFYTSILAEMPCVPVINSFDNFEEYKGEALEEMCVYLVEKLDDKIEYPKNKVSLCYGRNLVAHKPNVKIVAYLQPSKIKANIAKGLIKELYNDTSLTTEMKKNICNSTIGLLGKRQNKKHFNQVFTDPREAYTNVKNYGGAVHTISVRREETDSECWELPQSTTTENIYVHYLKRVEQLKEGFYLLSLFVCDTAEAKLFQLKKELESVGLTSYGCNTDCHYVERNEAKIEAFKAQYPHYFNYNNDLTGIGKLKVEIKRVPILKRLEAGGESLVFRPYVAPEVKEIEPENEWDRDELKLIISGSEKLLIKAEVAGAGKTSAFVYSLPNALFVCPWNTLCLDLARKGLTAITFNRLFGINYDGENESKTKEFSIDHFDAVVFDEVFLYNTTQLNKIHGLMEAYPNTRFYATGDENQNKPIETLSVKNAKAYYSHIVNFLFPSSVLLKDNKRCTTKQDQELVKFITRVIREGTKEEAIAVCKKYFKVITRPDQIFTVRNVVAYNATGEWLNNLLHKGKKEYFVGLELICRKTYRAKAIRTFVNYTYTITDISDSSIVLTDGTGLVTLPTSVVRDCFRYPYARTCHSYQGLSEDQPITIFDIYSPMADNDWLYTAITRTTKLENICIYLPNKGEDFSQRIDSLISVRIEGHLREDKEKGRFIEDFVDAKWVKSHLKGWTCPLCKCKMCLQGDNAFSVDRIDNSLGHTKSNCQVICRRCNSSKK